VFCGARFLAETGGGIKGGSGDTYGTAKAAEDGWFSFTARVHIAAKGAESVNDLGDINTYISAKGAEDGRFFFTARVNIAAKVAESGESPHLRKGR
jgi:hypothetical protein